MLKVFFLLFLLCFVSCSPAQKVESEIQPLPAPQKELKKEIPDSPDIKMLFRGVIALVADGKDKPTRDEKIGGINDIVKENGLLNLRDIVLPENDLEIRVWTGGAFHAEDGFILRRSSGNWSAIVLKRMICHSKNRGKFELPSPKSGWDETWKKLVDAEILRLPDSSELKYENGVADGKSYVVETNYEYLYRTYHYEKPKFVKLKEAGQMVKIGQVIADEFGLGSFSAAVNGCGKNE